MVALTAEAKDTIQGKLDAAVAAKNAPALIYGATTAQGEVVWAHSGPQDLNNPGGTPINPDSVLWICSQTKMITALATFQAIELGKITLDTKAGDILPELANPIVVDDSKAENPSYKPATNPILIRHLLNHSSGLSYGEAVKGAEGQLPKAYVSPHDPKDPIGNFWKLVKGDLPAVPLKFEPGTSFAYGFSNDALGFIVESVTGLSLEEHCKKHIFGPLGMNSTSFYLKPELKERLVTLSVRKPDGTITAYDSQFPIMEHDWTKVHLNLGGVGLFSTPRDYLTLMRHLLQILDGTATNPIVKKEHLQLFFESTLTPEGAKQLEAISHISPCQFGLGIAVEVEYQGPGRRKAGSGYWGGWAGTAHHLDPKSGVAIYAGSQVTLPPQLQISQTWEDIQPDLYHGLGIE